MKKTKKSTTYAEFDLDKIRRFTQRELSSMNQRSQLPLCYTVGNVTHVGSRKIVQHEQLWLVEPDQREFFHRRDAFFYCVAKHTRHRDASEQIYIYDQLLGRLESDAYHYRTQYRTAENLDSQINFSNRYTETQVRIAEARQVLKKVFEIAKYTKC